MGLENLSNLSLQIRAGVLRKIIAESQDDPRVEKPMRQLEAIEAEIQRRKEQSTIDIPPTPAQVVTLKTIELKGIAKPGRG